MNFELAKKLKDVGFPQEMKSGSAFYESAESDLSYMGDCDTDFDTTGCGCCSSSYDFSVKVPTLSELIEACGSRFSALRIIPEGQDKGLWCANADYHPHEDGGYCWQLGILGKTREEAVARLWLELNKK